MLSHFGERFGKLIKTCLIIHKEEKPKNKIHKTPDIRIERAAYTEHIDPKIYLNAKTSENLLPNPYSKKIWRDILHNFSKKLCSMPAYGLDSQKAWNECYFTSFNA